MGGTFGKSGSWVVDHSMDDIPLTPFGNDRVTHGSIVDGSEEAQPPPYEDTVGLFETAQEKKGRKRSHWIVYSTVFVMSIGFSIVLTSVWPYLQLLNDDLLKNSLGFVVAANPLGQMITSPLLGLWGNKAGKIRGALFATVFCFILGNAMYSLLALFEDMGDMATYYAMIVSRFIVGMSSSNVVLCRSYIAQATTVQERTSSIAYVAGAQALGFVFGPAIQTVFIILVPEGVDTGIPWLKWNAYTAAGWAAAALGLINMVILLPYIFKEYNIAEKERELLNRERGKNEPLKLPKPDPLSLLGILFGFFIASFIYVLIETLAEPFVCDQYAWTDNKAQVVVGVALMVAGLLATFLFPLAGRLARKYDERLVMLIPGFIPLIVGSVLFLPYPGHSITMEVCDTVELTSPSPTSTMVTDAFEFLPHDPDLSPSNEFSIYRLLSLLSETVDNDHVNCTEGCPQSQEWCNTVPQLPMAQLAVAFFTVMTGYPIALSICQGLYSKMLGPRPQGVWMGYLTGVGSLSRIAGPIFVSYIYTELGTYWCFGVISVAMVVAFIALIILYPRLVPMKVPVPKTQHAYDGPAAKPQANGSDLPNISNQ